MAESRVSKGIRHCAWVSAQLLIISTITFVLTEAMFRVYGHFHPTFIFHGSSYSRSYNTFRGKPNSPDYDSKLNSHGFKGMDYSVQKPRNTYRIIAIGDSFTFGVVPYQYNYIAEIEQEINKRLSAPRTNYEVINMGIPATGPRDYLTLLTDEGLLLRPDMLILSFFIGNDILEAQRNDMVQDYRSKQRWYHSSYVVSFVSYVLTVTRKYEGTIREVGKYDDNAPTYPKDVFMDIQKARLQNFIRNDPEFLSAFHVQVGYLQQIKKICDLRKIKLLVVVIPDEMQVNAAQREELIKRAKLTPDQVDMLQPNQMLQREFAASGIPYVDLLPALAAKKENLYKPRNTHWNIAGNLLAARTIAPKVIEAIEQK